MSKRKPNADAHDTDERLDLNRHLITNAGETFFVRVSGDQTGFGIAAGDILVADRAITPAPGELAIVEEGGELCIRAYAGGDVWATVTYTIHKAAGQVFAGACETADTRHEEIADLRDQLKRLERLPENEATRFQLETEIEGLERELAADEWPDTIDA